MAAFCLMISALGGASAEETLRAAVLSSILPPKLGEVLREGPADRGRVGVVLGKPAKRKGDEVYYYNLSGVDYDTRIQLDGKGRIHSVRYMVPAATRHPSVLSKWISDRRLAEAKNQALEAPPSHESGRAFLVREPAQGVELEFANADPVWIKAVVLTPARGSAQ
jgi:hypothetical protein